MKIYTTAAAFALILAQISCATHTTAPVPGAKTYAEISVKEGGSWTGRKYAGGTFKNVQEHTIDPRHTDHSFDIRYEGPGWESNLIAYRLYLDWRNAIDIFGKTTEKIILPEVGQDGFDSYHLKQDWGSDILKVGKGVGLGSISRIVNNEMYRFESVDKTTVKVHNAAKSSGVDIFYKGWKTLNDKINVNASLSIFPDERFTKYSFTPSAPVSGICTGIVKVKNSEYWEKTDAAGNWGYIATFGNQSMFDDALGMVLFYEKSTAAEVKAGPFDHLVIFKPTTKPITYYFLATWEKEAHGITTKAEFEAYINNKLTELNSKNKL
ncbi:DUF4861 family protein [Kaistella palustris]|uniref:DUF4861 family protein n=1 Tax=Kaistella palustris TaxID=493376 RepID=UPI0004242652|nr:DUF4861 family protein [Kaistella palustris]